jgi:hypothetical protein
MGTASIPNLRVVAGDRAGESVEMRTSGPPPWRSVSMRSAPSTTLASRFRLWIRGHRAIAALAGAAAVVILGYVGWTLIYPYTPGFQQDQYDKGYSFGKESSSSLECTKAAESVYGITHAESYARHDASFASSGARAFEIGCQDAVNGLPHWPHFELGNYQPTPGDPDLLDDESN